jgi:hypothetical protein
MQPQNNTGVHTRRTNLHHDGSWVDTTVTGTAGTLNAVLTGMESECAATVVVHWQ